MDDSVVMFYQELTVRFYHFRAVLLLNTWTLSNYTSGSQGGSFISKLVAMNSTVGFAHISVMENGIYNRSDFLLVSLTTGEILRLYQIGNSGNFPKNNVILFELSTVYWATKLRVCKFSISDWQISCGPLPPPLNLNLDDDVRPSTIVSNSVGMVLTILSGFDTILLNVTNILKANVIDSYGGTFLRKK